MNIQQAYSFTVETMPVQKHITNGQTAEIHCTLNKEEFRLYYTSTSTDQQTIDVYVKDSFRQTVKLSFEFNCQKEKEKKNEHKK